MSEKYPFMRDKGKCGGGLQCDCCDKPALRYIRWAFDYMRGNDETYRYCIGHYSMAHNQPNRMWAHMRGKAKWIEQKEKTSNDKLSLPKS